MVTDLERQFFDTFGIEPKLPDYNEGYCDGCEIDDDACERCCPHKARITDRILLELICILNPFCYPSGQNIQHLKESILNWCIKFKDDVYSQVQALFKEG